MRLLTFHSTNGTSLGVQTEKGIFDVATAKKDLEEAREIPTSMEKLIRGGDASKQRLENFVKKALEEVDKDVHWFHNESSITFGPIMTAPGKIICVGLNYQCHAEESGMPIPEFPVLFSKFNNALAGNGQMISLPEEGERFDYEAELAIVIGKRASSVSRETALSHIFGFCNANDFSCRDLQFRFG
jgi:2-keto-4-pentenoate hydratase/2-oxohepta-3-ene-1,7-dioic acid hydratase in catechol pathway